MIQRDTICALASGALPSAIAIIRISGPQVRLIGESLLGRGLPPPRQAVLQSVQDMAGGRIDAGLVIYMPGPASYTGEDMLEFHLHGGAGVIEHLLETLTGFAGVRLAEPGEFTRRAFEAGKLDLIQAEGVADLIEARTRTQKDQALRQLAGGLSSKYTDWRRQLTDMLALLEAAIDFPDEDEASADQTARIRSLCTGLRDEIAQSLGDGHIGERIRDGFRMVILGPPNAGKSTLLNRLVARDAAIVSRHAGTTRDVIEVPLVINGQLVWLSDTAGVRETEDEIESEGVRRARRAAQLADLRIILVDGTDDAAAGFIRTHSQQGDLLLANKCDLPGFDRVNAAIAISAETGEGLDQVQTRIGDWLDRLVAGREAPLITRARHRAGLKQGLEHINSALARLEEQAGAELVAEDVRLAARTLAALIGQVDVEDVLGAVFAKFCIGK